MSIKKLNTKRKKPIDYLGEFQEWSQNWSVIEKDYTIVANLVTLLSPFIATLIQSELSVKTIKNHMGNLSMLGSEIVRNLNDGDEKNRKLKPRQLLLKYITADEGPLILHLDFNDSADEAQQKSFDATCGKLYKFILASK